MLNDSTGSIDIAEGRHRLTTRIGSVGYALYGPYTEMQPGQYVVTFPVTLATEEDVLERICAVVDIVANRGAHEIATDYVLPSQLTNGEASLEFDVATPLREVEFRLFTTGFASLCLFDEPRVTTRQGTAPAKSRLRGIAPTRRRTLRNFWERGVQVDQRDGEIIIKAGQFGAFKDQLLRLESDREKLAERVVESVGYRGCEENSLFRAFVGTVRPHVSPPQPVPFTSSLCHQVHFGYDQYRFWMHALKETPKYQRKQWEFVYIAQALYERGYLTTGKSGLVFGAGEEQLPALFASFGVKVLATDQSPEMAVSGGWAESGQHTYDVAALNKRGICTNRMFEELVSYKSVDMNDIPEELNGQFDFCWSACALEHLGSLEKGLTFIEKSLNTLKPGGLAVHTTEYNISSNADTMETENCCFYRRCDIDPFITKLNEQGYEVSPIDWELGEGFAEMVVDLAPYQARGEPHIRLLAGGYTTTSVGLIIRKPDDA
jgi:2-polyprenyl-3-methyl-5-hydroxy-6-metoxy-1,4-benzoquinol methylase